MTSGCRLPMEPCLAADQRADEWDDRIDLATVRLHRDASHLERTVAVGRSVWRLGATCGADHVVRWCSVAHERDNAAVHRTLEPMDSRQTARMCCSPRTLLPAHPGTTCKS